MKSPESSRPSEHDKIVDWMNDLAEIGQRVLGWHPKRVGDPAIRMIPYSDRDGTDDNDSTYKIQMYRNIEEQTAGAILTHLQDPQVELTVMFLEEDSGWQPDTSKTHSVSIYDNADGSYTYYAMTNADEQWALEDVDGRHPSDEELQDVDSFVEWVQDFYGLGGTKGE